MNAVSASVSGAFRIVSDALVYKRCTIKHDCLMELSNTWQATQHHVVVSKWMWNIYS